MARPLNDLLKKEVLNIKEAWRRDQDEALQKLKDAMCDGRCLRPIDYSGPIFLYTDWSIHAIGAVLGQKDEQGVEHICVVISRSLSKTERQYASFQGEMLAVSSTDQRGPKNENADVPSRYPLPTTVDETGARLDREGDRAREASYAERLTHVAWDALSRVQPVRGMHSGGSPAAYSEETMEHGKLKVPKKIDTRVIDKSFFQEARGEGVICYEPCGGLCAGLEMLLRCGVKVNRRRHPAIFPAAANQLEQLPSNLEDMKLEDDLVQAGSLSGTVVRNDDITEEGESREVNLDEKAIVMGYIASELRMTGGMRDEELAGVLGLAMDRRAMELPCSQSPRPARLPQGCPCRSSAELSQPPTALVQGCPGNNNAELPQWATAHVLPGATTDGPAANPVHDSSGTHGL
ncbi:hypothetical protein CYMTET_12233 [Cymbomonas tetramitiformis]|uniref:Reverse transcriptase/retrotransposon-derived protein RNase H-like domain-containing protein n=1 Tax=Cymbomonas tetramitiformis TaxID=36881 RepID=A0AAE0LCM4_9CHLO|nr:hypothetical protein CYMTET_12233 [Cymbomonas tetramitiformis]